jgi:uncharacterized membrane protein
LMLGIGVFFILLLIGVYIGEYLEKHPTHKSHK